MHLIPVWEGGRKPVQESKYLIWFGFCRLHIFVCFFCYFSMSRKSVQNHFSSVLVGETASPLGQKMYALKKKKKTLQTGIVHVFDINTLYLYKKKKNPPPTPIPMPSCRPPSIFPQYPSAPLRGGSGPRFHMSVVKRKTLEKWQKSSASREERGK